jgi:hypothetical protein
MFRELVERVRCHHGAPFNPRAKIQVFSPNVLPQAAQSTVVELGVHGLALGDRFMLHNPSNVENPDEHIFIRSAALPCLLRSWESWILPLRRLV